MSEKKFSELPSAASLTGNELAALSQMQSGSLASVKSTLQAIANWFAVYAQYTTALQTTDKSIAGAINELKQLISLIPQFSIEVVQVLPTEDISDTTIYLVPAEDPEAGNYYEEYIYVNNTWELVGTTAVDLSAYYTKLEVDGLLADKLEADDFEANQTASANPITLETKQAGLAKSCVVEMNPIQDLHGYSNPWPAGGGKNELPITVAEIKSLNSSGTWSGNAYTLNNVVFTILTNDGGNVIGINVNGTANADASFKLANYTLVSGSGTHILSGSPVNGSASTIALGYQGYGIVDNASTGKSMTRASGQSDWDSWAYITVFNGYNAQNLTFYPMICLSTASNPTTFAPYENICPISGRTEASVVRTGKNLVKTVDWGGNQYKCQGYGGNGGSPKLSFNGKLKSGTYTLSLLFKNSGNAMEGSKQGIFRLWVVKNNTVYSFNSSTGELTPVTTGGTSIFNYNADLPANNTRISSNPFKIAEDIDEIRMGFYQSGKYVEIDEIQIELGSSGSAYEPYQGETHTKEFGQTVYGGTLDLNSGVLTITYGEVDLGNLTYTSESSYKDGQFFVNISSLDALYNSIPYCENYKGVKDRGASNMNDGEIAITNSLATPILRIYDSTKAGYTAAQFATALSGVKCVFELKTPTTIQLFPEALTLLKGLNVISTDGDKVQVEFSDIPVGDYSVLLDYIKSLEERIAAVEP